MGGSAPRLLPMMGLPGSCPTLEQQGRNFDLATVLSVAALIKHGESSHVGPRWSIGKTCAGAAKYHFPDETHPSLPGNLLEVTTV